MFDHTNIFSDVSIDPKKPIKEPEFLKSSPLFLIWKRTFDLVGALLLLPLVVVAALVLLVANRRFNPGPLLYAQKRMGRECEPFKVFKFRTMASASEITRGAYDALEHDRITPFGRFLRRCRIDELPQVLNVLRGDMSLIGPRTTGLVRLPPASNAR